MKTIKSIAFAMSSLFVLPTLAQGKDIRPEQQKVGMLMMRLNTATFVNSTNKNKTVVSSNLWVNLRRDFRMSEVNESLVRVHENKFANNRAYFQRIIERSKPYISHIAQEVKKRGMPAEIALLPFIESAFVTKAKSHVGASGLWQFMPATGRHYGLEQTPLYDGRHDVYAATDAALNYLQYLYGLFGDWSLALAAYNWGEGNVSRAINKAILSDLEPTYENLRLPKETRHYVPKLLAVRNLVNNPQVFGLNLPEIQSEPYFKAVSVKTPLDIKAAAHLANISEEEFLRLNPAFKTPVFVPKANRQMLLPASALRTFESNYQASDPTTLLSWDIFTPDTRMPLVEIAAKTGGNVQELKRLNGISGHYASAGKSILVNRKNTINIYNFVAATDKVDFDPVPDTFVEQTPVLRVGGLVEPKPVAVNTLVKVSTPAVTPTVDVAKLKPENKQKSTPETAVIDRSENHSIASTVVAQKKTEQVIASVEVAPEPKLNTQSVVMQTQNGSDELMTLAQEKIYATAAVKASLAKSEAEEAKARVLAEKRAINEAKKKQKLLAIEKAKTENVAKVKSTTHKVGAGETLYSIAKHYNVNVADLVASNRLKDNKIRSGQVLKVVLNNQNNQAKSVKAVAKKNSKANLVPASYVVKKGDTLQNIATKYHLNVNDIKKLNKGNRSIKAGQILKLSAS